jgi:hypothetical protein
MNFSIASLSKIIKTECMYFPDVYVPIGQQAISMLLYLKTSY